MFDQLAQIAVFRWLGLDSGSYAGMALHFFVMDIAKIFVLLAAVIFIVTYIRSYFSAVRTRAILARQRHWGHLAAGALGVVTPFCSCSAVPMFIGFLEGGVPLGVTMTFLIASPAINEIAIALLFGLFGWKVTALYIGSGLAIAIVGGAVIGALRMERHVEDYVWKIKFDEVADVVVPSQRERITEAVAHVRMILGRIWPYVVIGIGIGAVIHGYVPDAWIAAHLGSREWWSVPAAVALGVPLYGNAGSTLPAVQALIAKGVPMGTALALMMSITAISLPETVLLRKVLKPRLLAAFVGVVAAAIMSVGFLFNAIM
jgi:uncharacterized membrane protein YraQ (UPF0718 family)